MGLRGARLILGFALAAMLVALAGQPAARAADALGPRIAEEIGNLRSPDPEARRDAANAFNNLAKPATIEELGAKGTGPLVAALRDRFESVRSAAADALGAIHGDPAKAIPALAAALEDPVEEVRANAATAIGAYEARGAPAINALIAALKDPETSVREASATALGAIGAMPEVCVPALVAAVRAGVYRASDALARFGPRAASAVPALTAMLADSDDAVHYGAARAMRAMGPAGASAAAPLLRLLDDSSDHMRLAAAKALMSAGQHRAEALAAATRALSNRDPDLRYQTASTIGTFGAEGAPALGALTHALDDPDGDVRTMAAGAIGAIAKAARGAGRTDAVPALTVALQALNRSSRETVRASAPDVADAIGALETRERADPWHVLSWPLREQPVASAVAAGACALAALWWVLLRLAPLSVLGLGEALAGLPKLQLPGWLGGLEASPATVLLVGFFQFRDRTLDAFVARALPPAAAPPDTAGAAGVMLDGVALPALDAASLRPGFARLRACVCVVGEPDWSRAVAARIARLACDPDPAARLLGHAMLPVWFDDDTLPAADNEADLLVGVVRDLLATPQRAPSHALVAALLRRRRVLLVVPDLSERSDTTRALIRPGRADFAANALLVTSRRDDQLGHVAATTIRPAA